MHSECGCGAGESEPFTGHRSPDLGIAGDHVQVCVLNAGEVGRNDTADTTTSHDQNPRLSTHGAGLTLAGWALPGEEPECSGGRK